MDSSNAVQKEFYDTVVGNGSKVTLFTINGFQLHGKILGQDDYTIYVDVEGKKSLIYKHAISTITVD